MLKKEIRNGRQVWVKVEEEKPTEQIKNEDIFDENIKQEIKIESEKISKKKKDK